MPVCIDGPSDREVPAQSLLARYTPSVSTPPEDPQQPTEPESQGRHARLPRRRHDASGGLSYSPLAILVVLGVAVIIVVGVLVVTLTGGGTKSTADSSSSSATKSGSYSVGPSSAQAAALPELLCSGPSYVVTDGGQSQDQLLADPAAAAAKFPSSVLSAIAPGCMAGATDQNPVVIAFGPYPDLAAACAAKPALPAATYKVLEGSAATGLTEVSCP